MGDALLQKTYTVDFLNKTRVKNDGIVPQYYVQDSHEAIIPKNIFMKVQEELTRRTNINENSKKKRIYSSKYALSSLIKCGKCGEIYRRVVYTNRGVKVPVWRCLTRIEEGPHTCDAETLSEELIQEKVLEALNKTIDGKEQIKSIIKSNIEKALIKKSGDEILKLDKKTLDIQKEVLKKANEVSAIKENAKIVDNNGVPKVPMLMFVSNGSGTGWKEDLWREYQSSYIENVENAKLINLDCPHYIHDFEYKKISEEIKSFLKEIPN